MAWRGVSLSHNAGVHMMVSRERSGEGSRATNMTGEGSRQFMRSAGHRVNAGNLNLVFVIMFAYFCYDA